MVLLPLYHGRTHLRDSKEHFLPPSGADGIQKETYTKSRQKYYCHNFCAGMSSFWGAFTRFLCRDVLFLKTGNASRAGLNVGSFEENLHVLAGPVGGNLDSPLKPPPAAPFSESAEEARAGMSYFGFRKDT